MTQPYDPDRLNALIPGTLMETLGIRFSAAGERWLEATMPVTPAHHQPMGILHGGASAALIETVASAAANAGLGDSGRAAVGQELTVHHLKSAREGLRTARGEALHMGRTTQLWRVSVRDSFERLIAEGRLRLMLLDAPPSPKGG